MKVHKKAKAKELEKKGLYRRAADRWLDEALSYGRTAEEVHTALQNRKRCLIQARRPPVSTVLHFSEVSRAAKVTQDAMGLSKPGGQAFRRYDNQS